MNAKQKMVHGRGLSNLNLAIFVCSFDMFAELPNHSPLLTMPELCQFTRQESKWVRGEARSCIYLIIQLNVGCGRIRELTLVSNQVLLFIVSLGIQTRVVSTLALLYVSLECDRSHYRFLYT